MPRLRRLVPLSGRFLNCIGEQLQPKRPPALVHYTDQVGLIGILSTRALWASDILSLNDSAEFHFGFGLVEKELEAQINAGIAHSASVLNELKETARFPSFVGITSLSTLDDDLAQWRAYGKGSGGYAVRFSGPGLLATCHLSQVALVPVTYRARSQQALVSRFCEEALADYNANEGKPEAAALARARREISLLILCALLKSEAFQAEREWRIIAPIQKDRSKVGIRPGVSSLVKYLEVTLDDAHKSRPRLPLLHIGTGPNPNPQLARRGVFAALSLYKQTAKVYSSSIPFRDW